MAKNKVPVWNNIPGVPSIFDQQPDGATSKNPKRFTKAYKTLVSVPALTRGPSQSGKMGAPDSDAIRRWASNPKRN